MRNYYNTLLLDVYYTIPFEIFVNSLQLPEFLSAENCVVLYHVYTYQFATFLNSIRKIVLNIRMIM